jgi:hypothetical protein
MCCTEEVQPSKSSQTVLGVRKFDNLLNRPVLVVHDSLTSAGLNPAVNRTGIKPVQRGPGGALKWHLG